MSRDYSAAVSWWKQAAKLGSGEAHNALDMAYMRGEGSAVNSVAAWAHFRRAFAAGITVAGVNAEVLQQQMNLTKQKQTLTHYKTLQTKTTTNITPQSSNNINFSN